MVRGPRVETLDGYRRAATALAAAARANQLCSVTVSSALRGEGTTTVALQVALRLAEDFELAPLLIEMNTFAPALHRRAGLTTSEGGMEALLAGVHPAAACVQQMPGGSPGGLDVLSWRRIGGAESFRRIIRAMHEIIPELRARYDLILIDAPAVLAHAEALVAAHETDAVLLVAAAGRTSAPTVRQAILELQMHGVPLFGVVLNRRRRIIPGWLDRALS